MISRPARFWLWTAVCIALFGLGSWRFRTDIDLLTTDALLYAGILALFLWIVGLRVSIGGRGPLSRRKLRNPYLSTPEEFERLCAAIFRRRGYDVTSTKKGGDFGVDAVARKGKSTIVIGAKRYAENRKVGNRWVQQILGSMHHFEADRAVMITTSRYTAQAIEQAKNAPIELIDGEELAGLIRKYWL